MTDRDVFMSGDATVVYTGEDKDSFLRGWYFQAWQYRPDREDQPFWAIAVPDVEAPEIASGDWVLRRIGDAAPWVIVPDGLYQANFSRS